MIGKMEVNDGTEGHIPDVIYTAVSERHVRFRSAYIESETISFVLS